MMRLPKPSRQVPNATHGTLQPLLFFALLSPPDCWTAHSFALRHSYCPATPGAMANHVSHPQYCLGDTLATIVDHPQYRLGEYWPTCGSTSDLMGGTESPQRWNRKQSNKHIEIHTDDEVAIFWSHRRLGDSVGKGKVLARDVVKRVGHIVSNVFSLKLRIW